MSTIVLDPADWLARYEAAGGGYLCTPAGDVLLTSAIESEPRRAP